MKKIEITFHDKDLHIDASEDTEKIDENNSRKPV